MILVVAIVGAWLAASLAVGLVIGLVIRARDQERPHVKSVHSGHGRSRSRGSRSR